MKINVSYLDILRLEAKFDDFTVISDQPIRYKGDGSAPGPFDYFLASSAMCAAYFVKVYCNARNIPTENIRLSQNNIVDPENRYKQIFKIQVELPEDLSEKDRQDRKSTRLNSSHVAISYAVFCLKKKKIKKAIR